MLQLGNEKLERFEAADFPYALRGKGGTVLEQGTMLCYRVIRTGKLVWTPDNPELRVNGAEFLCGEGVASLHPEVPETETAALEGGAPELETPEHKAPKTSRKA